MQSLLRWSIENSEPGASRPQQPAERKDLDPAVIDMILGKPDSELMKQALAIAVDETRDEDVRIEALDNFEMFIESIDNANDLVKLKMWEPIHGLLTSPSSSNEIKTQVLWIIGTAVQNNPAAQRDYLALSPMSALLSCLSPEMPSAKTRSKAVYALSSLLKHCVPALQQLQDADGWKVLRSALQDPDITVRRKTAFLLNALLIPSIPVAPQPPTPVQTASSSGETSVIVHPDPTVHTSEPAQQTVHPNSHASMLNDPASFSTSALTQRALEKEGLLQSLLDALISPVPYGADGEKERDPDFEDKVVGALHTYVMACHGHLPPDQIRSFSSYLAQRVDDEGGEHGLAERWGLSTDEIRLFKRTLDGH